MKLDMRKKGCQGTSLLSFIMFLSIASLLISVFFSKFHGQIATIKKSIYRFEELKGFLQTYSLLTIDFRNLNFSRLSVSPQIGSGPITYTDGTLLAVSTQLANESNWWILYRASKMPLFQVSNSKIQGTKVIIELCHPLTSKITNEHKDAFAVSDAGIQEVGIRIINTYINQVSVPCISIEIEKLKQLFSSSNDSWQLGFTEALQIIDEKFLYLIDQKQQLRRIQIRQNEVIENQPCIKMVPIMKLTPHQEHVGYSLTCRNCPSLLITRRLQPVPTPILITSLLSLKDT